MINRNTNHFNILMKWVEVFSVVTLSVLKPFMFVEYFNKTNLPLLEQSGKDVYRYKRIIAA